jgi:hypothetical protein
MKRKSLVFSDMGLLAPQKAAYPMTLSQTRGKFLIDHKIDGTEEAGYTCSHEYFLRSNNRVTSEYREIGIVQIVTEKIFDYDKATEKPSS